MFGGGNQICALFVASHLCPCIYAVRKSESVKTLDSAALRSERTAVTHRGVKPRGSASISHRHWCLSGDQKEPGV